VDIWLDADPLYTNNIRRGHHRGAFGRVVGDPEVESGLEKRCYLVFGREGAEKLARINPQLAPRSTTRQLRTAPSRTRTPFASPRFAGAAPVGRANTARLVRGRDPWPAKVSPGRSEPNKHLRRLDPRVVIGPAV
jgi:hypothetical protein